MCLEKTAEDSLMFTNQMRIQSTLDDQVQEELSSNSLQHLQLAVDATASGILHQICKLKRKSIYKSFQTFEGPSLGQAVLRLLLKLYVRSIRGNEAYVKPCYVYAII